MWGLGYEAFGSMFGVCCILATRDLRKFEGCGASVIRGLNIGRKGLLGWGLGLWV